VILKLLSHNIRFGGAGRENSIVGVIRAAQPDIVVFQEAILPRVIEGIAAETGMPYWAARERHSIAYCSRIEIAHHAWHYPRGSHHPFMEIAIAGSEARIFGLHLRAMFSKWHERRRAKEIEALLTSIREHQNGFHVLAGDFNALGPDEMLDKKKLPHWIRAMVWLSGRNLQRQTIQLMLDRGYADAFRKLHPDVKGYTFPTWDPHVRLDYVFVPAAFFERVIECRAICDPPAAAASDHFPLLAELKI
jgi:endonuclease/exonuclease/phosphatase family metal-dependent hydrolase